MKDQVVIVLDCGATNVRAIAVNQKGEIVAGESSRNQTSPDPNFPEYLIWDVEKIWQQLSEACLKITKKLSNSSVVAVTVTTFGVDGAPIGKDNNLLYPVVSWACKRTEPIMQNISRYIPIQDLYALNGINEFSFNTLYKLIWFRENKPDILDNMSHFAFISSIFLYKLSDEWVTERTMAGTSMLTGYQNQEMSDEILNKIGLDYSKFKPLVNSGEVVGYVTQEAASITGLPKGTPVLAGGHDTQFALFGSGANENEAILSSGTWEILMTRTNASSTSEELREAGVTTEFDSVKGMYNPGMQWLGSGIIEWVKNTFYQEEKDNPNIYSTMVSEAEKFDKTKITFALDFINSKGGASGLGLNTSRGEIFRALLESLSHKTKESLQILERSCGFKAKSLTCVGGGSKNKLWNQLRANILGIPVKTISITETTVLGAALFAFYGIGAYNSPEEARKQVNYDETIYSPNLTTLH